MRVCVGVGVAWACSNVLEFQILELSALCLGFLFHSALVVTFSAISDVG